MSDRDLDIPELHLALTTLARERVVAPRPARRFPAFRTRAVAVLCVAAVALAGVLAVSSPARTPDAPVAGGGPAPGRIAAPDLVRCALAALPEAALVDAGLDGAVLAAAEVDRDAGRC